MGVIAELGVNRGSHPEEDAPGRLFRTHSTQCSLHSKTGTEWGVQETPAPAFPGKSALSHYTNVQRWEKVEFLDFMNVEIYSLGFNKEEENGAGL